MLREESSRNAEKSPAAGQGPRYVWNFLTDRWHLVAHLLAENWGFPPISEPPMPDVGRPQNMDKMSLSQDILAAFYSKRKTCLRQILSTSSPPVPSWSQSTLLAQGLVPKGKSPPSWLERIDPVKLWSNIMMRRKQQPSNKSLAFNSFRYIGSSQNTVTVDNQGLIGFPSEKCKKSFIQGYRV